MSGMIPISPESPDNKSIKLTAYALTKPWYKKPGDWFALVGALAAIVAAFRG